MNIKTKFETLTKGKKLSEESILKMRITKKINFVRKQNIKASEINKERINELYNLF